MNTEQMNISFATLAARVKALEAENAAIKAYLTSLNPAWNAKIVKRTAFEEMPIIGYIVSNGPDEAYARSETTTSQFLPHNIRYALETGKRYPVKECRENEMGDLWFWMEDGLYVFAESVTFTPMESAS